MKLCEPCGREWLRWLDYRPAPPLRIHTVGGYSARNVIESRRARADDAYATIRRQQDLIARTCAANHQGAHHGTD